MPCPDCGASVDCADADPHLCDQERWLDFQLFRRREEVERFEPELAAYLETPHGRFELWYAARSRRRV